MNAKKMMEMDVGMKRVDRTAYGLPREDVHLRVGHEYCQSVFEHSPIGMAVRGVDGRWLRANRSLCELFGYTEEELLACGTELVAPLDGWQDAPFQPEDRENYRYSVKQFFPRKDGSEIWCRHSGALVHGQDGQPAFFIAMIEDIGGQKAYENAMERLSLQYEMILNSSGDGIVELDTSGRIMFINAAGADMLGWPVEDLLLCSIVEVLRGVDAPDGWCVLPSLSDNGKATEVLESWLARRDGSVFFASFSCTPILKDGKPVGLVLSFRDNTRRKTAEDALKESHAEMKSAYERLAQTQTHLLQSEKMASIGQLAAGVAHEINNPLSFVISNLGTLEKYTEDLIEMLAVYEGVESILGGHPDLLEQIRAVKQRIDLVYLKQDIGTLVAESRDGLDRVKRIVMDLKNVSRVDEQDQWVKVDLHQCLDSTLNIVRNEFKYKAKVVREYGDLPDVECLPSQLNQAFMNMLVNAGQAIEDQGSICICTGREGESVWVEFTDTGRGIDAEHLKRIFEPFFTTKPIGKGTGLGLSISYNIVSKHEGCIEVQSEVGHGTTFRVWLPIKQAQDGNKNLRNSDCTLR